jgi:hypothetical protein
MKQLVKLLSISFLTIGAMASCSDEVDTPQTQAEGIKTMSNDTMEYLNITYNGVTYYNVPTTYDENGDFVFNDNDFAPIYAAELANDPDWSISANDASNITFYSSLASNLKSNGIEIDKDIKSVDGMMSIFASTRTSYEYLAEVTLYDDTNYKDRNFSFQLNDSIISTQVANLKQYSFNDKCSSLIITNNMPDDSNENFQLGYFTYSCSEIEAVFIGYDDKNFSDRTITCVCPPSGVKKYPSLPGFNDKLSSFKFFFAKKGQYSSSI